MWANALFMGTQPEGRIYVHNFTTGNSYLFVETEDVAVVAFAEFGGKLYAGTQPAGIVYGFDGTTWREEHRPYGLGVTAMVSTGDKLLVFSRGAEGPVAFDGSTWSPYPLSRTHGQGQTVASFRPINGDILEDDGKTKIDLSKTITGDAARLASPTRPQFNLMAAAATAAGAIAGGSDDGIVLLFSDKQVSKMVDVGMPVDGVVNLDDRAMMVSSGGTIVLVTGQPVTEEEP